MTVAPRRGALLVGNVLPGATARDLADLFVTVVQPSFIAIPPRLSGIAYVEVREQDVARARGTPRLDGPLRGAECHG